jgi:NodT family efflux transporter outer membrane factor (OMF) lipoprotein
VDEAAGNHPSLQLAAARVSAARAYVEATGADRLPTVGASLDSTYQRFTEHGLIPPPLAGASISDNQLALNVSYEVDFWHRHASELRSALSQEKAAQAEEQSARLMLSTAVARNWVQLARQYAQLDLVEQQLALREKLDALTRQRVQAGLDTRTETQQSLLQVSNLKAEITQWKEGIALTRNQLAALLGQGPERGQSIARPVLNDIHDTSLPAQLPLELLGRRPDIVAARWQVEAKQGDIDVAKTEFYPNINLIGFAGLSSLGVSDLFKSGSAIYGIGPAIRLPVFVGGRLRGNLKSKVAGYDAAVATYNQSLTDALHEVADQVQSLQALETLEKDQRSAEQAAAQSLQLAQQRQAVGTANMMPVLNAQGTLLTQQKQLLDSRMRRADLHLNLIKALGGGYQAPAALPAPAAAPATPSSSQASTTPEAA